MHAAAASRPRGMAGMLLGVLCLLAAFCPARSWAQATLDFGDHAPFPSASSTANNTLRIGATVDAEAAQTTNSTASGDDITGTDDEDGVTLPVSVVQGASGSISVNVTNTRGSTAYLNVWIDWNGNGVLTDSGDQVATNTTISNGTSNSNRTVTFTTPTTGITGKVGVRVRLTSGTSPGPDGLDGVGEVEDHLLTVAPQFALVVVNYNNDTISRFNGGTGAHLATWTPSGLNAPNYGYRLSDNTFLVANGGSNTITKYNPFTGASLGTLVNSSSGLNFPYQMAVGSDGSIYIANQNAGNVLRFNQTTGAVISTVLTTSSPAGFVFDTAGQMYVTQNISGGGLRLYNSSGGFLSTVTTWSSGEYPRGLAWGPDGRLYVNVYVSGSSTGRVDAVAFPARTRSTFVTMDSGSNPYTGIKWGPDGNLYVVDYGESELHVYSPTGATVRTLTTSLSGPHAVAFTDMSAATMDFGDYSGFASAGSTWSTTLRLGNESDTETAARNSDLANGDDIDDIDDEDGVTLPDQLNVGQTGSVTVKRLNTSGSAAYLNAWIDFNDNGVLTDSGEQVIVNQTVANGTNGTSQAYTFSVPSGAVIGSVGARFRISSTSNPGPTGNSGNGEVEDYMVQIGQAPTDFGDYSGFASASSNANSSLRIGATVDTEGAAQTSADADGDDTNGSDDEDGVTIPASLIMGDPASITVNLTNSSGSSAYLNVWIDYNRNGVLTDSGEQVATNTLISNGTSNSNRTVSFTVPETTPIGEVAMRVRLTSTSSPGPTGHSGNGEVEDHMVTLACPTVTVSPSTPAAATAGVPYSQVFTQSGGHGTITWSVPGGGLPPGLTLDSSTGELDGTPTTAGSYSFTLWAVDAAGCSGTRAVSMTVAAMLDYGDYSGFTSATQAANSALRIGTAATDVEASGLANSTATGDDASGTDDEDLTMPALVIGSTATLAVPVTAVPASLSGSTARLNVFVDWNGDGDVADTGETQTAQTVAASGTYNFSLTPPAGITPGTKYLRLRVTEGATAPAFSGSSTLKGEVEDYAVTVSCQAMSVGPTGISAATVGSAYTQTFTQTGANGTVVWSLASGSLPAGLTLDTTRGIVSGTPTGTASASFTLRATDAAGCSATRAYSLAPACPAISITPSSAVNGTLGLSYSQALTASGGTAPYGSWTVTSGTLPAGLSLNASSGVISGTPTASNGAGTTVTVRVNDTYGCQGSQAVAIKICPVITVNPTSMANGMVGIDYSQTLSASGGAMPYTYAVSSGSLPAGLSLSADGAVTGSPTGTAAATFTIRATDANGCTGTRAYTVTPAPNTDFGDFSGFPAASNTTNGTLRMGASLDTELSATTNTSATGDDTTGTDDEDGVTMPASITAGASVTIPVNVTNLSGSDAYINAWFDFNNSGSLGDAGDQVASNIVVPSGTNGGTVNVTFTVPAGASVGTGRGVRFRFTTNSTPGFSGTGSLGEVEDYIVTIAAPTLDFGDFSLFGSASSTRNSTLRIGATVDAEGAATVNDTATGDDTTGSDDEDGVTVPASVTQGNSGSITVNVTNSTASTAYLNVWIDWNGNGVLTDGGEQVATNTTVAAGTSNSNRTVSFTVPALIKTGPVGLRVRLTSNTNPGSTGQSGTGEVEDHRITLVANTDFGDYALFPSASSKTNSTLRLGALVDAEGATLGSSDAAGDDEDGTDDEDGVTVPAALTQGAPASLTVSLTNSSASTAYLNAWVDFNRNGVLTDSGEQIAANTTVAAGTTNASRTLSFNVPVNASLGEAGVRVRLTSTSNPGPSGLSGNGEVEDHLTSIVVPVTDFGDDSDFADASSIANGNLRLGAAVDVEGAATKNTTSTGDDATGADDEDAVSFPSLTAGQPVTMPVLATNLSGAPAYLNAWIDFNDNGVLTDSGEQIATNVLVPNGTDGSVNISFTVPTNAVTAAASVGSRFRLTSTTNPGPVGASGTGEVEDHQVVILAPLTDFGDHSGYADVSNTANTKLRIGATVDTEYASTRDASATGDDVSGVDDEDGVTLPDMTAGAPATIVVNVTNTNSLAGHLNVWVDFNNNGSFGDSGEQVMANGAVANGTSAANVNVSFTVPAAAVTGTPVGVRARLTHDISPGWSGAGGIGEVEDHVVTIAPPVTDFGDFLNFADASSVVSGGLRLGALTDTEFVSTRNAAATGDDVTGVDDEDAVVFPALTAGAPATVPVVVTNTSGAPAYLNAWIDYNNNGVLTDAGEQVATNMLIATGTSNAAQSLNITVPATALTGVNLGARFRLTSTTNPGAVGASGNGEVEDYVVNILAPTTDFGDHSGFADASQGVNPALRLGAQLDAEYVSTRNATATGDDTTGIDDEDGVTLPFMTAGQTVVIPVVVTNTTGATGYLNAWFDYNNNGVLTDGGEQIATNLAVASGTSGSTVNLTVAVPANAVTGTPVGLRFRFSAPSGLGPIGSNALAGEIEDYVVTIAAPVTDFGDFQGFADASSVANSTLRLGALTDTEFASTRNAAATGDDTTGVDDEDAVTLPAITAGTTATIPVVVTNTSGSTAYLNAWIDFNNNGLLTDVGEQVAANLTVATGLSGSTSNLSVAVPAGAVTGVNLGARFRLTSTSNPGPTGASGNGEVEDYVVNLIAPNTDFGDFSGFGSAKNATSTSLRLGTQVDNEGVATTNSTATGDDTTGVDDEDGVTLPAMTAGQTLPLPVLVTNISGAPAYMNVWIDFNNNGAVTDAGEQVVTNLTVANNSNGLTLSPNITIPATASTGTPVGVRVRLTAVASPGAVSELSTLGEIEDYVVTISTPVTDFGDFVSFGDASSVVNSTLRLGALTDTEFASTRNTTATGDDVIGVDDEDAVVFPALTAGAPATVPVVVTNTSGAPAYLNAWIDFNNNGVLTDAGEQVATNVLIATGTSNATQDLGITVPATALTGVNLGARFRLTSTTSPGATGASGNGEVEDHMVSIALPPLDYGDHAGLPSASSTANNTLRLGASVDTEFTPTANAIATGDDITGADDEDGVNLPALTAGAPAVVPVVVTNTSGAAGYLNAWFDFNNNGVLTDAGEQIAADIVIDSGTTNATRNLSFTVPAAAATGANVALRFRLTSSASPGVSGNVGTGEVEDYVTTIAVPTTDFGDWSGAGDAWSTASSNLRMGALADTEFVSTRNAGATGDDITGSDDEEGVTLAAGYNLGASSSLAVVTTNLTGATAYLNAWVDWNNNGVFSDSGEQIATNVMIASGASASTQGVNFTVPSGAIPGGRGARFRLTSVQNPTPLGAAGVGEVEDYLLNVYCPTVTVSPASLTAPTVGASYSASVTASGGSGPYLYAVSSGSLPSGLSLNGSTGVISGICTSSASQTFTITATDLNSCSGSRSFTMVPVCPAITISPETASPASIATAYSQTLTAAGGSGSYGSWTVISGSLPAGLTLGASTGIISGTPTSIAAASFTVRVTDSTGCTGTRAFTLTPACPVLTVNPSTLATPTVGTAYSATVSASGAYSPYTFAVTAGALPAWATLNPSTGVISGTPTGTTSVSFTITATDRYGCQGVRAHTLAPVCPAITVNPTTLANGTLGLAYSQTMSVSGGTAPHTWSTVSGTWPAGLSLSSGGVVSGTPTAANPAGVGLTIRVTDAYGCAKDQLVSLKICPVISVSPASLAVPTVGTAYSATVSGGNGTAPYDYAVSSGSLPAGLSLDADTGGISGTPTSAAAVSFTVRVTDANGCVGTRVYNVTPVCPVVSITPATAANGTVGSAYSQPLTASGGTAPYTGWTVTSGTLPAGLSLGSGSGFISGTPTASNGAGVSITVRATDANGCQGSQVVAIKICPVISVTPTSMGTATVGTAYSQAFGASGGASPYTYSVTSGSLPAWATLTSGGVLSGTPNSAVSATFTIAATDANGCVGTRSYTLTPVCSAISITPSTLPYGVASNSYTAQTFASSGGLAPYSYSVSSGTLPPGLTLTSAGVLSGMPTTAGTYAFIVRSTDSRSCSGTRSFSLVIHPASNIGNLVWIDTNNNGVRDSGEAGINGVTVVLWRDANSDGDFVDEGEATYASTVTTGGVYQFTNVPLGRYKLVIPNPPPAAPWASRDVDLNDNQQDNDSNGYQRPIGGPVSSPTFDISLAESDFTLDFGLVPPATANERMVMYLADLNMDIIHKFVGSGSTGIEIPGAWGGIPWVRSYASDSTNGITNPHGVWFNGENVYVGGQRNSTAGTYRYNLQGQLQGTSVSSYRLTHVTLGDFIYYPKDTYVSINSLSTGAELGRVNLSGTNAVTWGITVGADGFLYVADNYESSTFPNGSSVRGSGKVYRVDPKPGTFTSPATVSYSPIITGLNDLTGIDGDDEGNIYTAEVHLFNNPPVPSASRIRKYSPQGTLLATYQEPGPLNGVGVEDAWGLRWNPVDGKIYVATRYGDCVARLRSDTLAYDGAFIPYVPSSYGKTLSLQIESATFDFGDLPDSGAGVGALNYETPQENGGPYHVMNSTLRLGALVDGEHAANPGNTAQGDDLDNVDDEDSIATMPAFVKGQTISLPVQVHNHTGATAYLVTLFDWNMDGDFLDSGERIQTTVPTDTSSTFNISVAVPVSAMTGVNLGMRLRISTTSGLAANGAAPNGEVEDYIINVVCPAITLSPSSPATPIVGSAYSQALTASGGTASYSYAITSGSLPAGLSLSSGGVITGTPTSTASATFTVRATDAGSCTGTQTYTLAPVCPALTITPASLLAPVIANAYTATLSASGGTASYSYAIASGSLPAGLSLSSGGVITGTATSTASAAFTVRVTDARGCTGTRSYMLTPVCPTLTLSPASAANGTLGISYSQAMTATGGTGAYAWTVASGTLPAGLSLGTDGVISGTPASSNGAGVTVGLRATDAAGCQGTQDVSIKICPVVTVTPASLAAPVVGTAYSATVGGSGGAAPYTFAISGGSLPAWATLNSATGVISGMPNSSASASFTVRATDANGCSGTRSYTLTSSCPTIFPVPLALPAAVVGTVYNQTLAPAGGTAPYSSFTVTSGTLPAGLTLSSAGVLSGTPTTANGAGVSVTIRVTDAYGCQGSQVVNVKVCPVITVGPASLGNGTVGQGYSATVSGSGGTAPYTYSIISGSLPSWATLGSSTGVISGTPNSSTSASFTVRASDANGCQGTRAYTITPVCPALSISDAALPLGMAGTAYNHALSPSGGTGPYTWAVTSGTLPAGLGLSTSGVISGTPTASNGSGVSITFRATDAYGCQVSKALTLKVCAAITLAPASLADGVTGAAYSQVITASGGAAPYTYTVASGTLPAGLTLSSGGTISGTPTANVSANITVSATDAAGCVGTRGYTLSIGCPAMDITPASLPVAVVGSSYSQAMTASGGTGPYTWTVSAGSLPAGLTLGSSGLLGGTPTTANGAGTVITLRALDSTGCAVTRTFTLQVCPVVAVGPASPSAPVVGASYSQTFSGSGGTGPYVFAVASGSLPEWAAFNTTTGELTGTPASTTSASFILRATDANGCTGTRAYTLTPACPAITLSPASLPAGTVGTGYNQTLTASGGNAPYSGWTVTSGTLPAGLNLNSGTGAITGTPTAGNGAGVSVTIRVTDAYGCQASQAYTVKICPVVALSPSTLTAPTIGTAYSQALSASGGATPYTFTVSSGSLPAWATLNSGTGAITGTPTSGTTAAFGIRATDANGCSGTRVYSLTPACPVVTVGTTALPGGVVGTSYSQALSATGGTAPYTWTTVSGSWPAGLSLSSAGLLSGTPTAAATPAVSVTVRATDAYGCSREQAVTVQICPAISLSPASLPAPVVGTAYSQTVAASGGAGAYTYTVASGSLPAWATLGSGSGAITGLPTSTAGASFTVRATDANGCSATRAYVLNPACPAISITPAVVTGYVAASVNQALSASGGTGPYTGWTVTSGTLPSGLTLNSSTGVISGTPLAAATAVVSIRVTDAYGCQVTQPVTVQVKGLTLGNRVWQDNNNNGQQDAGEPGVAGAVVQLMNPGSDNAIGGSGAAADVQVGALINTDASGQYAFTGLTAGRYYIRVIPPSYFTHSSGTPATADDDIDGNNDGSQPGGLGTPLFSPIITLAAGAESVTDGDTDPDTNLSVDFGLWTPMAVGNFVFLDINGDGRRNNGESLPYVYMELYREGSVPGVDAPYTVNSAGCGCKGRYMIENIDPGRYFIHVPASQFATGMPLEGLLPMGSVVAGDDDVGQDLLFEASPTLNGASTAVFALTPGQAPTGAAESGDEGSVDDDNDSNIDLTKDLGFASPSGTGFALAQRERRNRDEDLQGGSGDLAACCGSDTTDSGADEVPVTFATWRQTHPDTDGDALEQLVEYAFDTDPADGRSGAGVFRIETTAAGRADVLYTRPANGRADLRQELQMSLDGLVWAGVASTPAMSIGADGREIVRHAGVDVLTHEPRALFRLKLMLDADLNGTPEATATTPAVMFSRETFPAGQRTFSMPLVRPELYAGQVTVTGSTVTLPVPVTLPAGAACYLEEKGTGVCHEVDEAASTATTLVLESAPPSSLTRAALRVHHTLSSLLPADVLTPGTAETGDRVLAFDPAGNRFISTHLAPDGWSRDLVLPRGAGLMVHIRHGEVTLLLTGQVAVRPPASPAAETRLMGSGHFMEESPASLGLTEGRGFRSASDPAAAARLRLWLPDTGADQPGYDQLYLSPLGWMRQDDSTAQDLSAQKLLPPFRAFFLVP